MLITHYRFALPASFDMDSVRQRIRDRASVFDALPALGWKAFLVSDRSRQRGADNAYAPVYFWPGTDGWLDFLRGPLFAGVAEAFGHTAPWTGLHTGHRARLPLAAARWCRVRCRGLHGTHALVEALQAPGALDGSSTWWALDTARWQLREFGFLHERPHDLVPGEALYEVCHLSSPGWPRT